MKRYAYLIFILQVLISCENTPCEYYCYGIEGYSPLPEILSVQFSPKKAKVGDTINMIIVKEKNKRFKNLDYNKDFEITDDGKIKYIGKYIGTYSDRYPDFTTEESRMMGSITFICPEKADYPTRIEVTEYVSIQGFYSDLVDVLSIDFKVPVNAKSGYIRTTDPVHYYSNGYSDEKLIIVDENGKEITE